jgi:hypothetical protein
MDESSAKLAGSGTAGILEATLFHPADTISKRLMSNKEPLVVFGKNSNIYPIIFHAQKTTNASYNPTRHIRSLYNGFGFSLTHRFIQRMYGYGGQPILREYAKKQTNAQSKTERILCDWYTGALIGFGETLFMPFDLLKVKKQTNPASFHNRSFYSILQEESPREYFKGAPITTLRNTVGMGNFFTVSAVIRECYYDKQDTRDMSMRQYIFKSLCSSFVSLTTSSPFDVVKTRVQNKDFGASANSVTVVYNIMRYEGPQAFFKSLLTKYITIGPKIVFTYSISLYLSSMFQKSAVN